MFAVLWFIMIRPQMKRQKEAKAMMEALAKNDEVVTAGGILGRKVVLSIRDTEFKVDVGIREAKDLHRPFVLHMALKDRWVQAEVNELLERRLSPNPLVTIHKYPGADHAFARHGGKTYSKPEAERALALTLAFFEQHLGG